MAVTPDTLIIGGGIIGLLTARELAMAGKSVTVLERNKGAGQESSWAGGGILSPLYPWRYPDSVTELQIAGHRDYPRLAEDLLNNTGIDPEFIRSGHLILDTDEFDEARLWAESFSKRVIVDEKVQFLSRIGRKQIYQLEPELSEQFSSAMWLPAVGQLRNPRLVQALIKDLVLRRVKIVTGANVEKINTANGQVVGVETSKGNFSASTYLAAAGAWTASLLEETGIELGVIPVRGQMVLFKVMPGRLRRIVMNNGKYLIPRKDGHVLAGSTLEYVGFDKQTTEQGYQELLRAAFEMIPYLKDAAVVGHWAGLRPGSEDGVPIIDQHPTLGNLVICSGHFRNGIIIGLGSARIAAALLSDNSAEYSSSPYRIR